MMKVRVRGMKELKQAGDTDAATDAKYRRCQVIYMSTTFLLLEDVWFSCRVGPEFLESEHLNRMSSLNFEL